MKTETFATWALSFVAVVIAMMIACRLTMIYGGTREGSRVHAVSLK